MTGWIKLYRKILENPIATKDTDYFAVWIYLLLKATHKEIPALFKGKKIMLSPGQLITGRKSISNALNMDENKVQRIINVLKGQQQITQQTSNKNRLITIINWNEYQLNEQQDEQQINDSHTAKEQQVNTNKNVINTISVFDVFDIYTTDMKLKQALRGFAEMRENIKCPLTGQAAKIIIGELNKLSSTDAIKVQILEQSIINNWKDVFPLRQKQQKEQPQNNPNKKYKSKTNSFYNFDGKMKNLSEEELEGFAKSKSELLKGEIKNNV